MHPKKQRLIRILALVSLFLLQNRKALAQEISLPSLVEINCSTLKGTQKIFISNRGQNPLHLLSIEGSHDKLKATIAQTPILPGNVGILILQYELSPEKKNQSYILRSNAKNHPQIALLLVAPASTSTPKKDSWSK